MQNFAYFELFVLALVLNHLFEKSLIRFQLLGINNCKIAGFKGNNSINQYKNRYLSGAKNKPLKLDSGCTPRSL